MSVLCCRIPDFLLRLAERDQPTAMQRPLALLGANERVLAVSPAARQAGVRVEMTPGTAQARCPDLRLRTLDTESCRVEQSAFLDTVSRWQLPVEAQGWGMAYVDMQDMARSHAEARTLGAELGRNVRTILGHPLQPGLGWDSSKFTARAAASVTQQGRMRLVGKADEPRFLNPLPIHLLPLPPDTLQTLHWLGIRTLGQYAALPASAVWQRFGTAGREAQRWAKGQDDRPVRPTIQSASEPLAVDFDPPTGSLPATVDALMAALQPSLQDMQDRMEGCHRLSVAMRFVNGAPRRFDLLCLDPVSKSQRLRELVSEQLASLTWPAELERMTVQQLARAELPAVQMPLLGAGDTPPLNRDDWLPKLAAKYGPVLLTGQIVNAQHPVAERRFRLAAALP